MKTGSKILVAGAAGIAAAYYGAVRYFFNMAFERKLLRAESLGKPFGQGTPYEPAITEGRRWLREHQGKKVSIKSEDSLRLWGHYISAPEAKRTVIMCHGWRGKWDYDFAPSAKWFYENGCSLLLIEERAQGDSEGKYMGFGLRERRDCLSWVHWLNETYQPERIYFFGVSMGASTVLMAAGDQTLPENVKGIVADCGFTDPYAILSKVGKGNHRGLDRSVAALMKGLDRMAQRRAKFSLREYSAIEAMKTGNTPVLFIHGKADSFVSCEMTVENYEACRAPKTLLLVEGAGHCMSFLVDPEAYTSAVRDFFAANDGGSLS